MAEFVHEVSRKIQSPMTFLWDRYSIHCAEPVYKYLCKHRTIVVEPFPPCAPKLNPVDEVWCYVKYGRMPNYTPRSLLELRDRVSEELSSLRHRAHLLESLFRRTKLTF